jgi:hypothetical protein
VLSLFASVALARAVGERLQREGEPALLQETLQRVQPRGVGRLVEHACVATTSARGAVALIAAAVAADCGEILTHANSNVASNRTATGRNWSDIGRDYGVVSRVSF